MGDAVTKLSELRKLLVGRTILGVTGTLTSGRYCGKVVLRLDDGKSFLVEGPVEDDTQPPRLGDGGGGGEQFTDEGQVHA